MSGEEDRLLSVICHKRSRFGWCRAGCIGTHPRRLRPGGSRRSGGVQRWKCSVLAGNYSELETPGPGNVTSTGDSASTPLMGRSTSPSTAAPVGFFVIGKQGPHSQ
jgi:hypothetical protein